MSSNKSIPIHTYDLQHTPHASYDYDEIGGRGGGRKIKEGHTIKRTNKLRIRGKTKELSLRNRACLEVEVCGNWFQVDVHWYEKQ